MAEDNKDNKPVSPSSPAGQPAEKPPAEKVTAESQKLAPGKAGDAAEGKDLAAVKPDQPQKITEKSGLAPDDPEKAAKTPTGPAAAAPKPPAPAAPAGTPPHRAAAPAKPAGPTPEPWQSERVDRLKKLYGSGIREASTYLGQNYVVADRSIVREILQSMRDDEGFDYLVDVTAVHYPQRELQFDVVWILYSFSKNERMRVKTQVKDGESAPSVTALWETANWLERECFDMFGIQFEGHPDLRRILLPDGWKGYPLRKDYSIIQQDQEWVQINLGIPSGQ